MYRTLLYQLAARISLMLETDYLSLPSFLLKHEWMQWMDIFRDAPSLEPMTTKLAVAFCTQKDLPVTPLNRCVQVNLATHRNEPLII